MRRIRPSPGPEQAAQPEDRPGCPQGRSIQAPSPRTAMAVSSPSGSWISPATASPRTMAATITPNSGRPEAKFLVPSTGSITKARSASPSLVRSEGSFSVASSPTSTACGKACNNPLAIIRSAASSASVTRSMGEDFCRTSWADRLRKRGMISTCAASRRSRSTVAASWVENSMHMTFKHGGEAECLLARRLW
jgi:hypothetical protein